MPINTYRFYNTDCPAQNRVSKHLDIFQSFDYTILYLHSHSLLMNSKEIRSHKDYQKLTLVIAGLDTTFKLSLQYIRFDPLYYLSHLNHNLFEDSFKCTLDNV